MIEPPKMKLQYYNSQNYTNCLGCPFIHEMDEKSIFFSSISNFWNYGLFAYIYHSNLLALIYLSLFCNLQIDNVITSKEPEFIQLLVQMPQLPCLHEEIFTSAAISVTDHHWLHQCYSQLDTSPHFLWCMPKQNTKLYLNDRYLHFR